MRRLLAFFGAFNPPTVAHLELARFAAEKTGRDGVIFVPSQTSYIYGEQGKDFAFSDAERLAMLRAAARTRPWMSVTGWELEQETQPRTYRTLCHLREEGIEASLLFGSDKLGELESIWFRPEAIAEEFGIVCMTRGSDDCKKMIEEDPFLRKLSPYITIVRTPRSYRNVSSTGIRQKLKKIIKTEKELERMVPEEILPQLCGPGGSLPTIQTLRRDNQ